MHREAFCFYTIHSSLSRQPAFPLSTLSPPSTYQHHSSPRQLVNFPSFLHSYAGKGSITKYYNFIPA